MNHWLNIQNKRHFKLYSKQDNFNKHDDRVSWLDPMLFQRSEMLNKLVARVSPRKGKKEAERIVASLYEATRDDADLIEEIAELLEDGYDVT